MITIIAAGFLSTYLFSKYAEYKEAQKLQPPKITDIFVRRQLKKNNEVYKIVDYNGPIIASSFHIKDGMKHQNAKSYYFTGEQFRTALYYYDTLVAEYYLYKSGDTIFNYPKIDDNKIYHITLKHPKTDATIEFDVLDYKVLMGSYVEK